MRVLNDMSDSKMLSVMSKMSHKVLVQVIHKHCYDACVAGRGSHGKKGGKAAGILNKLDLSLALAILSLMSSQPYSHLGLILSQLEDVDAIRFLVAMGPQTAGKVLNQIMSYGDCEPMKANASALMIRMLDEPFNPGGK
eukprot:CAMPEP_0173118944 /NCGR_PEP_ID=MMETSP1102-20130122/51439_1 /TAXON_ID=49646 /ORGANISM="Geminigera sp., Strain Caron Lab Isolate" /LENGTH=138 /DNA_ID=CAMNT_0014024351 /DNA_START=61 /DNA_END=477 /DNA_ORIENTATION=-